jgi:AraC-like DNA-binding protein
MDSIAGLLDGPRAREAFVLRSVLRPPWSLRIQDDAPLSVIVLLTGGACVTAADGRLLTLAPGNIAIVRGPEPYLVSDHPNTPPQAVIHPGQVCTDLQGRPLTALTELAVRTWGHDLDGPDVLITGSYQLRSETGRRLLSALPPALLQPVAAADRPLLDWLASEVSRDEPGQTAVLDRLLDLLLVSTVRSWFARPETSTPGWYLAHADPMLAPVLKVIEHQPDRPWSVAALADVAGVSRATLARRFTEVVGEPPMAFLTHWRLAVAADLMREPDATLGSIARQVGYNTPFALSAAFTRERGITPHQHRHGVGAHHGDPRTSVSAATS